MAIFPKDQTINVTLEVDASAVEAAVEAANESILACNDAADYAMDARDFSEHAKNFTDHSMEFCKVAGDHSNNAVEAMHLTDVLREEALNHKNLSYQLLIGTFALTVCNVILALFIIGGLI